MGSASRVAQTLGLNTMEPPLDWLPRLPEHFRKRTVRAMTLAQAREVTERSFIKPTDEKAFPARVFATGRELPEPGLQPADMPVLVQEVVVWELEFRCFVLDGRVKTLSVYARGHELARADDGDFPSTDRELREAKSFCEEAVAAAGASTPAAVVVDVGVIAGRGWAVVEANAANGSGLYGCNPIEVLKVLRSAVTPKSKA